MAKFVFNSTQKFKSFGATVWHEFTPLAQKYNAVNLGQGFPNFNGPDFVLNSAKESIDQGLNQYARSGGHPRLVKAISDVYSTYLNRELNSDTEIVTTCGSSEGIFATLQALLDPGDEVILFEPYFDIYLGAIAMANATPVYVPMKQRTENITSSSELYIDSNDLSAAITEKTKVILINNPHNPTGKVFTRDELMKIYDVIKENSKIVVVSDEVYENFIYDNNEMVRLGSIPEFWERTIACYSAGKTFSVTGWKIGWCIGPAYLIKEVMTAHQFIPFSIATPLQEAIASGLEICKNHSYYDELRRNYSKKRQILVEGLKAAGLTPIIPEGSFFILADCSKLKFTDAQLEELQSLSITKQELHSFDWNVCRYLTIKIGVAAIPPSAFFSAENAHLMNHLVRFAFCKTDEELYAACDRLKKLLSQI